MTSHVPIPTDDKKNEREIGSLSIDASVTGLGTQDISQPANDNASASASASDADADAKGHEPDNLGPGSNLYVPSLYAALGFQRRCPYQWWLD